MFRVATALLALLTLGAVSAQSPQPGRRVAITIDDGPVVNEMTDLGRFQRITNGLIGSFQAEKVPVTMFVNEAQLNVPGQRDSRAAVLDQWLDAGFDLANHSYSHQSANQVPFERYADEIVKGEVITRAVLERRGKTLTWFRYPYLHAGRDEQAHGQILSFLESRGYRVAPVTVDYADYSFAGPYSLELRAGNVEQANRIRQAYIDQVDLGFEHAEKASMEVFGREIAQILLIHCNELNAMAVRDTITRMRQRGYRFITLDEAMADPAFARRDTFTGPGGSWLSRSAAAAGTRIESTTSPRVPAWVTAPPATP
jgi:peptidoglycan/xylan/chitin deacetylase (PgdA/CDA1 family)